MWAEVLSADAYGAFEEAGLDNEDKVPGRGGGAQAYPSWFVCTGWAGLKSSLVGWGGGAWVGLGWVALRQDYFDIKDQSTCCTVYSPHAVLCTIHMLYCCTFHMLYWVQSTCCTGYSPHAVPR